MRADVVSNDDASNDDKAADSRPLKRKAQSASTISPDFERTAELAKPHPQVAAQHGDDDETPAPASKKVKTQVMPVLGQVRYSDEERIYFAKLHAKDVKAEMKWEDVVEAFDNKFKGTEMKNKAGKVGKHPGRSSSSLLRLRTDEKADVEYAEWDVRRDWNLLQEKIQIFNKARVKRLVREAKEETEEAGDVEMKMG